MAIGVPRLFSPSATGNVDTCLKSSLLSWLVLGWIWIVVVGLLTLSAFIGELIIGVPMILPPSVTGVMSSLFALLGTCLVVVAAAKDVEASSCFAWVLAVSGSLPESEVCEVDAKGGCSVLGELFFTDWQLSSL